MTAYPIDFDQATRQLSIELLGGTAKTAINQLSERGYEVHAGLTPEFASAIAVMSREPAIREYCPKDADERFTDLDAVRLWLSKGRGMFLLLKRSDNDKLSLAGYGWAGPGSNHHLPDGQTTFALRIGQAGQGQGMATPFSLLVLQAAAVLYGAKNIWLETWSSNGSAVHIYHKLGFVTIAEEPGHRQLPDGQTVADTRLYMSRPNELLPDPVIH